MSPVPHLYLRDPRLELCGEFSEYQSFNARLVVNDIGNFTLAMPADGELAAMIDHGYGVALFKDHSQSDVPLFSGPIKRLAWTESPEGSFLTLAGPCDNYHLRTRVIQPTPSGPPYVEDYAEFVDVPADQIMGTWASYQLGPDARSERRLPHFNVDPPSHIGESVDMSARFDVLLDKLKTLAAAGGGLIFRAVYGYVPGGDGTISYRAWMPADRRSTVVFSRQRGTILSGTYEEIAPEANYIYALGEGAGIARQIVEGGDNESITYYRARIEKMYDARSAKTLLELTLERDAALQENAGLQRISITPAEQESIVYGRDYRLGDRVTAEVLNRRMEGYVSGVDFSMTADRGLLITPIIEKELRR